MDAPLGPVWALLYTPRGDDESGSQLDSFGVVDKFHAFSRKQLRSLWLYINWEERQTRREQRANGLIDEELNAARELVRKEIADIETTERARLELPYSQLIEGELVVVGQAYYAGLLGAIEKRALRENQMLRASVRRMFSDHKRLSDGDAARASLLQVLREKALPAAILTAAFGIFVLPIMLESTAAALVVPGPSVQNPASPSAHALAGELQTQDEGSFHMPPSAEGTSSCTVCELLGAGVDLSDRGEQQATERE